MIFNVFIDLGNQHYHSFLEHFHHCSRVYGALLCLHPETTTNVVSVLCFLDIFCKWNRIVFDFFHLSDMFGIRSCSRGCDSSLLSMAWWYFVTYHGWLFMCSYGHLGRFHFLAIIIMLLWTFTYKALYRNMF